MQIIFPTSTAPSINPAENGGRLINCYAEKAPDGSRNKFIIRRAPGLELAFAAGSGVPRGALVVGTTLYIVNGESVYTVTKAAGVYTVSAAFSGSVGGSGPVFMAHNMKSPTNDILITTSAGMHSVAGTTVSSFSDGDLPSPLHVTFQDGYFFFPTGFGLCFASGLNDIGVNSNDYTTAEAMPDGLVRAVPFRRDLFLMGTYSTELWSNVGNATGFPYDRGPVLPIGLFGIHAVAGFEPGFPGPLIWVGNTGKVYRLDGYEPTPISSPHLERLIAQVTDRTTLRASVYMAAGHAFWSLSSPDWTWVYDLSTEQWHERATYSLTYWLGAFTINAFDEWLAFTSPGGGVFRVNERVRREGTLPLVGEIWSTQQHGFPARTAVTRASFDFIVGVGNDRGIDPIETNPQVSISWSDDGGVTFGNPLLRSLGTQGEQVSIDIWRTGLTGRQGRQWKLQMSDPAELSLIGGSMFGESRL